MHEEDVARTVGWLLLGLFAALAVSGVGLSFEYRPTSGGYFHNDVARASDAFRLAHNLAALAFVPMLIAYVALVLLRRTRPDLARSRAVTATVVAAAATVAAFITGVVLAWDQLALWAVSVNMPDFRGVWKAAFDHVHIRFLLVGHSEISQGLYRNHLLTHVLVVPALLALSALLLRQTEKRRRRRAEDASAVVD